MQNTQNCIFIKSLLCTSKVELKQQHCCSDTSIISLFHYLGPFQQQLLKTSMGNVGIYPLVGCFTPSKATFRKRSRTGQKTRSMRTSPGRKGALLAPEPTGPNESPSQQEQLCELRLHEEDLLPYHPCLLFVLSLGFSLNRWTPAPVRSDDLRAH